MGACESNRKDSSNHKSSTSPKNETKSSNDLNKQLPKENHNTNTNSNTNKKAYNNKSSIFNMKVKEEILHYNVLMTYGIGFYCKVLLCTSKKNKQQKYAIKTLKETCLENESAAYHLHNEIKILNKLKFDFVIPINDIFDLNSREYIVYPFYNLDIFTLINEEKKKIPEEVIQIIISQIYSCLTYMHDNKIVYRDLKPENVMIDIDNGVVRLIDFGLAVLFEGEKEELNELCGTNEYIPPEVINHCPYSYDFDEWTFGIFCYEITFGETPFKGKNQKEVFESILNDEVEIPTEKREISEELSDLLNSLLQKEKNERMEWDNIPFHPFFKTVDNFEYINNKKEIVVNHIFRNRLKDFCQKYENYFDESALNEDKRRSISE